MNSKIKVIPCSGIGKVLGLLARESVLTVTQERLPNETETLCLAHVVTGDDAIKEKINGVTCVTMDGCPKYCSKKSVELAGGIVAKSYKVPDFIKPHRGENHGNGTYLTEQGWEFSDEIADTLVKTVKELQEEAK